MSNVCIIAWVYGRVQGVGFRYTTQHEAQRLGLTGYAKNMDDGSVEVVACGDAAQVEKLIKWLKSFFRNKRASLGFPDQVSGFIIIDSQYHIHTGEKLKD